MQMECGAFHISIQSANKLGPNFLAKPKLLTINNRTISDSYPVPSNSTSSNQKAVAEIN